MKRRVRDEQSLKVIADHNNVHNVDAELRQLYGELYHVISRAYIYDEIRKRTGYCTKSIAYILNHTKKLI